MNIQLRLPKRQIVTAISQLSQEIINQKQVENLIVPESSYQVIPGYLQSYIHNIDNIIRWLLPHSKSRLIEISLPFTFLSNNLQQTRILGKYILFDRKLRGIRISLNNKYANELPKSMSPTPLIQQYYKQNRINFNKNQILIGDFYLQMIYRVGLFFQDELLDFASFKNTYEKYRFDIITVMSNVQKKVDKNDDMLRIDDQQRNIQHKLKTLSKQNKITVLYTGIKIVPNQRIVYWEKSFIIQDTNLIAQPKSVLGEKNFIALVANVELSLQKKWQVWRSNQNIQIIEDENQKYLQKLQINMKFRQAEVCPSMSVISLNNKKFQGDFYNKKYQMVYNFWFLYRSVNRSTPFVIPYPFSNKRQKLYNFLLNLSQHCNKDIRQLTLVYCYKDKVESLAGKYPIQIYHSFQSMLTKNRNKFSKLIYLYCEDPDQVKKLRNNDQYGNKICNCQSLIPNTQNEVVQIENNQTIINKKIENLCNHVLKERFQNIEQILNYFWNAQLNREQIQKCFSQIIPNKVKKYFKLTPHYLFFLQSTPQEIINEIGQAEVRLKSLQKSRVILDENDSSKNFEQFPKRLIQRIEATRRYKNNLTLLSKCHRCELRFKKDMLQSCSKCSSSLCFDCIDVLTNHSLFELSQYKCAICLKLCKCNKCEKVIPVKKIPKQQSQEKINSFTFSDCGRCLILDSEYAKIQIECTQCKKLKCYNCARSQKTFQVSKMSSWICKGCKQFNEDFINRQQQKEHLISIQVDQNDMNQEIIEDSVSRSASPARIVEEIEKDRQIYMKPQKKISESSFGKKISQKSNELSVQKIKSVNNQSQERLIIQQQKNDKFDKNSNNFDKNPEQDSRFNDDRERLQRQKQREKSRQRIRSRSKEKKKRRTYSSQSSERSRRKQNNHKRKNKLWGFDQNEKEHKREKSAEKNKYKEKDRDRQKDRGKPKKNKNSQSKKKRRKSSSSKESSPIPIRKPSPIRSGLIFKVNPRKEIPESQQQSY